jgi:hypothetical protein
MTNDSTIASIDGLGVGKNDRTFHDMTTMIDPKYNDKYFVHRVIRFFRDHPERTPDYEDFVPDWRARNIDDVQRI